MAGVLHHSGRPDWDQSRVLVIVKAIATVLLVTAVVAAALGGATYVVSRAFVRMLG